MTKREKIRLIKSVFAYLQRESVEAWASRDEDLFDWYSAGLEAFYCIVQDKPITHTPRVKPLPTL